MIKYDRVIVITSPVDHRTDSAPEFNEIFDETVVGESEYPASIAFGVCVIFTHSVTFDRSCVPGQAGNLTCRMIQQCLPERSVA